MKRVLVIANSAIIRAGLETLIATNPALEIVGSITPVQISRQLELLQPDVVLLVSDGADNELLVDAELSSYPIVLLLEDWQEVSISNLLRSGVLGILPLEATADEIIGAIEAAALGLTVLHPDLVESLLSVLPATTRSQDNSKGTLTTREIEVLGMLAEGLGNKAIARRLNISEHTVKFHIGSIFSKLNASTRTEAVILGARQGLILL